MLGLVDERFQSLSGASLATFYRILGQGALVLKLGTSFVDETNLRVARVFEQVAFDEL